MKHKSILDSQKEYVISMRREFHTNPELSWNEVRTSKRIKEELDKMGIPWQPCAKTGVVALVEGALAGGVVALRADIDALPVTEENDVPYKSANQGVMHACGHDGHAAMLLGAAKALAEIRSELSGTVKLLFQPAEEKAGGAKLMIEEGALEGVEAIMGIHLWNNIPSGKVNIQPGPRMASGDVVSIDFIGKGGHGSLPNQTVDPIVVASSFVMNSQAMLSREKSPLESVVFTLGEFKAGTRFNVIPEKAHMEGTFRCFSEESRKRTGEAIKRYADETAKTYRAEAVVSIAEAMPATINDPAVTETVKTVAEKVVGSNNLVWQDKTTGSEDMAYYLQKIPGAIAFVGSGYVEEGLTFPHHHPKFNINEESLANGTALYFGFAVEYLGQNS